MPFFSIPFQTAAIAYQRLDWDTCNNDIDDNEDNGRSFVSVLAGVIADGNWDCDGRADNEGGDIRMNIQDNDMVYLGSVDGESYGPAWKVTVDTSARYRRVAGEGGGVGGGRRQCRAVADGAAVDRERFFRRKPCARRKVMGSIGIESVMSPSFLQLYRSQSFRKNGSGA